MDLKITTIQADIYWEDVARNLQSFALKIAEINEADIIVLPEMFNTGFSMHSEKLAEKMDCETVSWMKGQAKKSNAVVVGSLIVEVNSSGKKVFFNRLIWMQPNGDFYTYDKRHLFRMADEHKSFTGGQKRLIMHYKGWRICPLICYDLRFPVWSRNKELSIDVNEGKQENIIERSTNSAYDCLIYIACWPAARKKPWSKLLEARAIENQCYVVGLNRVGEDGNNITYSGNSVIINPRGEAILEAQEGVACILKTTLSLRELDDFRTIFPVGKDGDDFQVSI